jgi:hypothetical protein
MLERADVGGDPVRQALRPGGLRKGIFGSAHHRDEDLCTTDLTGGRVDHCNGIAAVIDEQFLPRSMHLAHRARQAGAEALVVNAELAVTVGTFPVRGVVLLPQQLQRHRFAFEFLVQIREVRLRVLLARRGLSEQQPLQGRFVQISRQRPVQALLHGALNVVADRALGCTGRGRDPLVTEFRLELEAQNLFDLAHGTPFG